MDFDRVARIYRTLETIVYGRALQRARVAQLGCPAMSSPRVLLLGDGDGRFLEVLLRESPDARVDVVEASARMVELARRRVPDGAAVTFHQLDVGAFVPNRKYDLVVSHFFLDCFVAEGVELVATLVSSCLSDGGSWLISDFQMPQEGWLRPLRAKFLLWTMYRFFRATTEISANRLVDPDPILGRLGFRLVDRKVSNFGFVRADRWSR